MDIGGKIKRLRVKNRLTLEELAERSELTKGFLSQVERNLTSPSIATLEDILEALGTTLGEVFAEEEEEKVVFTAEDFFISEQDGYEISFVVPNAQKNDMEPIVISLSPGMESKHYDPLEDEEFGYVLQGEVELHYGSRAYKIKKGQTFYLDGGKGHFLRNSGKGEARVLWVSTPPSF
jgi:transcriptional regulator with XRE-family HTH domain